MALRRHSAEQIAAALKEVETGVAIGEVARGLGIPENTPHIWKKRFGDLGKHEIREINQLRKENVRLKRLVADLTLDKAILQDMLSKNK